MYAATALLSVLAATGALAAPHSRRYAAELDTQIRVLLSDGAYNNAEVTLKEANLPDIGYPTSSGPFSTIEIKLGADVANKALRCAAFDQYGNPVFAKRGANHDVSFSDADKGAWTFDYSSKISSVVCDPSLKAITAAATTTSSSAYYYETPAATYTETATYADTTTYAEYAKSSSYAGSADYAKSSAYDNEYEYAATSTYAGYAATTTSAYYYAPSATASSEALEVTVILQSQAPELGIQTTLTSGQREVAAVGTGPFQTVELSIGSSVAEAYRCQILDNYGKPLIVLRGGNRDVTFSDADKGLWTLETPSDVSKIVCDPTFVAQKL